MPVTRTNTYTQLYYFDPTLYPNGSKLDETLISNGTEDVRRTRILLAGDQAYDEIVRVKNTAPAGDEYALLVRNVPSAPANITNTFGETAITALAGGTTNNAVTYTPSGVTFVFTGFTASSDLNGKYEVFVGTETSPRFVYRTTNANPNVVLDIKDTPLVIPSGTAIKIKATNYNTGVEGSYSATILGYTVP
jgi:hypothetical protein